MYKASIQIKALAENPKHTWEDKCYALQQCAQFLQAINSNPLFASVMTHGPLPCNPDAMTYTEPRTETAEDGTVTEYPGFWSGSIEGFLGDCNGIPNAAGVCEVVLSAYGGLKIVAWPPEAPFYFYGGDTSEQIPKLDEKVNPVTDAEGNPVYETVYAGVIQ